MCRPPIKHGYLRAAGRQIVQVGSVKDDGVDFAAAVDLGDVALLPRLVNSHTHLEFSDCDQPIGHPGISLADWIGQVIRQRGKATEQQRRENVEKGRAESSACGVALVGDIATTPSVYPIQHLTRVVSFAEVLGLSAERSAERMAAAEAHHASLQGNEHVQFGISPHAPYSTPPDLIRRCVQLANRSGATLSMHVAESGAERMLLENGRGAFAESLRAGGLWRDGIFPWPGGHPLLDLIDTLAAAPRVLLVHGNDLRTEEIDRIARHRRISVVYCPRTHHFFGYPDHPVQSLLEAGIRVVLGTDSRASNPDLNLWKEVQFLLNHRTDLDPYAILKMATVAGADALLGAGSEIGTITAGSTRIDDLVSLETDGKTLDQVWHDFAKRELLCTGVVGRS
ncbi:MAG: amidohydrolase family protein [Planctomycetales bacterium]|nr:amidohydrolase family protein [Planctomycetales bacterium]